MAPIYPRSFLPTISHRMVPDGIIDLDQADVVHAVVLKRQAFADHIGIKACHELFKQGALRYGQTDNSRIPQYLKSPRSFHTVFSWQ